MARARSSLAVLATALSVVCALPAQGQPLLKATVFLGAMNELEVVAEYHDPGTIAARLQGTRVVPLWLHVKNTSSRPVSLAYADLTLDLGDAAGAPPLAPVSSERAREILERDGHYNLFTRFLSSQGSEYESRPLARVLPSGPLPAGKTREGYVVFVRPGGGPFDGFMALGMAAARAEILTTNTLVVRPAPVDAPNLWVVTMGDLAKRFADLRKTISEIVSGPPPFRRSYALLLGVSDYQTLKKLPMVKNDLDKLEGLLKAQQFTVVRVQDQALRLAHVTSPQQFFAREGNINPEDRLLVFFAGHGFQREERGRTRGYLALRDADPNRVTRDNAIAMDEFVAWAQRVPAKHLLVLLESCFSGLAVRGAPRVPEVQTMGVDASPRFDPKRLYQLSSEPGRYLLMAGTESQPIPMSERWGGGLFAHAVMLGLKGSADTEKDGFITTRELYPWLRNYVEDQAMKVLGERVTPLITDLGPDRTSPGEFVFTAGG
jgi:hypothetical protein